VCDSLASGAVECRRKGRPLNRDSLTRQALCHIQNIEAICRSKHCEDQRKTSEVTAASHPHVANHNAGYHATLRSFRRVVALLKSYLQRLAMPTSWWGSLSRHADRDRPTWKVTMSASRSS